MIYNKQIYNILIIFCFSVFSLCSVNAGINDDIAADSALQQRWADSAQSYTDKGLEYSHKGNFESAEAYLRKSLDIYQKIYQKGHWKIGHTYVNLGAVFLDYWKYDEAMYFLEKAEKNFNLTPGKYSNELGAVLINKGIIFKKLGDLQKAKLIQEMALKILLDLDDSKSKLITINLYNSLASITKSLGDYHKGIEYYMMAENLALEYNRDFLHVIYNNLGNLYEEMKNFKQSEAYFKKAISEFPKQSFNPPFKLALFYSNYARLCLKHQLFEKSYELNRHALHIAFQYLGEKNPLTSDIHQLFGRYFEARADYDSALYYYQKSICSLFDDFDDMSVYANPDISAAISKTHLLGCLKSKANAFKICYQHQQDKLALQSSLESYDLAVKLIDEIRMGYQDEESKLFLNENERITYDEAISVAYMMYHVTGDIQHIHKAFEYSEKSKASVLLSALRDAGAKGFGGIPDSLLKQENDLTRDIAFYSEQLYEEKRKNDPDSLKIDLGERKLFRIKELYDDLISTFENSFPDYHALKYNTGMIAIEEIQKKIKRGTTVLEYALTDSILYTFFIRKDHFGISSQPLDSVFQSSYNDMLETTGYFDPTRHDAEKFIRFISSSSSLYNYLIKPQVGNIKGRKLIIIPDGILAFIPFEALISDAVLLSEEHLAYRDLPFLLKEFAISYDHSSTMLFEQQITKRKRSSGGLLAFAPSYNGTDKVAFRGTPRYNYRKDLSSIPGAREEVEKIIRMFRGNHFLDNDATELKFKKHAGDYDILHLAMHAVINNQNPMYSKLIFTANPDSTEDDLLNTHEIYGLNLKARMVVLSSCSSGEGILQKGEGVISLARGFSYAGCPSLVMTLWEIEDKASVDLMVGFYRYLKKGYQKDLAMQKAKTDFLFNHPGTLSHPFYWSAFQCIGDTSPLYNPFRKYIYIICSALVVFGYVIYRRRRMKT